MNLLLTTHVSSLPAIGIALRAIIASFFVVTSLFSLLAFVPFTYEVFHKAELVPVLNSFGRMHHRLYWGVLLLAAIAFALEPLPGVVERARKAVRVRAMFWLVHVPIGVWTLWKPVFAVMVNGYSSYLWALAMLEPLLYLSLVLWWERWPGLRWSAQAAADDRRVFFAAACSAAFLSLVYSLVAIWRGQASLGLVDRVFGVSTSFVTHLLVCLALFVILNLIAVVAGWFRRPPLVQFAICYLFGCTVFFLTIRSMVFPSISFNGFQANFYAGALAVTVSIFLASLSVARHAPGAKSIESGLTLALWMRATGEPIVRTWRRVALSALALGIAAAAIAIGSAKTDWNHLFQKLTALAVWIAAFRLFYAVGLWKVAGGRHQTGRLLIAAFFLLPAYRLTEAGATAVWPRSGSPVTFSRFLDVYSGFDASFKIMHDALGSGAVDNGYYQFLSKNTNLPRSVTIKPAPMNLADASAPPASAADRSQLPHIFIITVDSLRRDYLAPYNSQVDFTPSIAKFAQEGIAMKNSFTRYGGTGLSEPSIWVGGMMIHQQYVTPFSPMNSMQRVLEEYDYKMFVSRDSILQTVVAETPKVKLLDEGVQTMNYDLCRTLTELEPKLDAASHGPVFAYTQPQNIHISAINREGGKAIDDGNYGTFYAPYASRLKRLDGCFGDFIQKLKNRGIYDSSIVVLTADHGDSLGEEGRWGHAYTIFPEILRVPLIIHLPASMRDRYVTRPEALSFNSDLSPTIHYLLGKRPIVKGEMYGRPLFTEKIDEQNAYKRDHYLVSSSYAAVHGILSGDGRFLYTSDAVNFKESWFDMTETAPSAHRATSSMKLEYQKLIREKIGIVSRFYSFAPLEGGK